MKLAGTWIFFAIWLYHLATGVVAGVAIFRIWPERANLFVRYTLIHLHAAVFDALGALVCLLLAKDVVFTWKFTIAVFSAMLIRDIVRAPLLLYILRPSMETGAGANHSR